MKPSIKQRFNAWRNRHSCFKVGPPYVKNGEIFCDLTINKKHPEYLLLLITAFFRECKNIRIHLYLHNRQIF